MHPLFRFLLEIAALCAACVILVYSGRDMEVPAILLALGLVCYHGAQLVEILTPTEGY
jgi:trehalose-6-phosphatase